MVAFCYLVLLGCVLLRSSSHAALTAHMDIRTMGDPDPPPPPPPPPPPSPSPAITAIVWNPTSFHRRGQGSSSSSQQFVAEYGTVEVTGNVFEEEVPTDPTAPSTTFLYDTIKSWVSDAYESNDDAPRRSCRLEMLDPATGTVVREFNFIDSVPLHFELPRVESGDGDLLKFKLVFKPVRVEVSSRRRLHTTTTTTTMRSLPTGSDDEGLFWLLDYGAGVVETFDSMVGFGGHSGAPETKGGRLEWNSLTLKGAVADERANTLAWFNAMATEGSCSECYKDVSVTVRNPKDTTEQVLAVDFRECFLTSYSLTALNCEDECEAMETVEIAVGYSEGFS